MINQAELDLRIATHFTETAQRNLPNWQPSTQRASVPGTLATKFLALTARFAHARPPHQRPDDDRYRTLLANALWDASRVGRRGVSSTTNAGSATRDNASNVAGEREANR